MGSWKSLTTSEQEAQFRQFMAYFFTQTTTIGKAATGVLSGCTVTATTPSASGLVNVDTGLAICQPTTSGGVFPLPSTNGTLDIFTANPMALVGNPRNDIVVIDQVDGVTKVKVGTPNATPSLGEQSVASTEVALARLRHLANATTIPSTQIDDLRVPVTLNYAPTLNRVKITSTSDQTLADNTVTVVNFSATSYDVGGMADLPNNRIKIITAGWYTFTVRAMFAFNNTGYRALIVEQNATTIVADSYVAPTPTNTGSLGTVMTYTTEPILCAVNDTFRVKAIQTAGGTLPLTTLNGRRVVFAATQVAGLA